MAVRAPALDVEAAAGSRPRPLGRDSPLEMDKVDYASSQKEAGSCRQDPCLRLPPPPPAAAPSCLPLFRAMLQASPCSCLLCNMSSVSSMPCPFCHCMQQPRPL